MKILGFIMGNKILTAVVVIAVVAALYFGATSYAEWEEGAPELTILVHITDVETQEIVTQNFNLGKETYSPLTAYTAQFPALDPIKEYTLGIDVILTPDSDGVANGGFGNEILATGEPIRQLDGSSPPAFPETIVTSGTQTTISSGTYETYKRGVGDYPLLRGQDFDGASLFFTISVTGLNAEGAYSVGTTEGTITLEEGERGTIIITVDDIDTNATPVGGG